MRSGGCGGLSIVLMAGLAITAGTPASGDVVTLTAGKDNSLFESSGSLSNGSGPHLLSGQTNFSGRRRALIWFDVSGIPANSTVTGVQVVLTLNQTVGIPGSGELHRVLRAWGEGTSNSGDLRAGGGAPATAGDATWTEAMFGSSAWTTPGGDFTPAPSATTDISTDFGPKLWDSSTGLVADVQHWVDQPGENHGWIVLCDDSVAGNARRFSSREDPDPAARPMLVVTFAPPSACAADFNGSGSLSVQDIFDFLAAYFANDPAADFNTSGALSVQDIFDFLAAYFAGCV